MGACCSKASKTKDPDKAPYSPAGAHDTPTADNNGSLSDTETKQTTKTSPERGKVDGGAKVTSPDDRSSEQPALDDNTIDLSELVLTSDEKDVVSPVAASKQNGSAPLAGASPPLSHASDDYTQTPGVSPIKSPEPAKIPTPDLEVSSHVGYSEAKQSSSTPRKSPSSSQATRSLLWPQDSPKHKQLLSYTGRDDDDDGSATDSTRHVTTTVQSRKITLEDNSSTTRNEHQSGSVGEPADAEAILESIRSKARECGVLVSAQTKTTIITKQAIPGDKDVINVHARETKSGFTAKSPEDTKVIRNVTATTTTNRDALSIHEGGSPTSKTSPHKEELALLDALQMLKESTDDIKVDPNLLQRQGLGVDAKYDIKVEDNIVTQGHVTTTTHVKKETLQSPSSKTTVIKEETFSTRGTSPGQGETSPGPMSAVDLSSRAASLSRDKTPPTKLPSPVRQTPPATQKPHSPRESRESTSPRESTSSPPCAKTTEEVVRSSAKPETNGMSEAEVPTVDSPATVRPGIKTPSRIPSRSGSSSSSTSPASAARHVEAKVFVSPPIATARAAPSSGVRVENGEVRARSLSPSSSSTASNSSSNTPEHHKDTNIDTDETATSELLPSKEPVHQANLKKEVKATLLSLPSHHEKRSARPHCLANTRTKILQFVNRWFEGKEKEKEEFSQVLALTGELGSGKTTLAAEVCRKYESSLAGCHFFQYNSFDLDNNEPRYVLQSLARGLCDVFPNYASLLPRIDKLEDIVQEGSLIDLFATLFQEPLLSPELRHDPNKHMLIILDALDECDKQYQEQFIHLTNSIADNLPDWLYVLVTVRNDPALLDDLNNVQTVELKSNNDTLMDIKRSLKEPMSSFMDRISLDGGVTELTKQSEGSFLAAHFLKRKLDTFPGDTKIALREVEYAFPKGLTGTYKDVFQGLKKYLASKINGSKDAEMRYDEILGVLAHAKEPLPTSTLDGFPDLKKEGILSCLYVVLEIKDGYVSFSHKHTSEWLMAEQQSGSLGINPAPGRAKLAELCLAWLGGITGDADASSPVADDLQRYALKHALTHLTDAHRQQENIANLLCSLRFIQKKLSVDGVRLEHLLADYKHAHYQTNGQNNEKHVLLADYMRKSPRLFEQMKDYYTFVKHNGADLEYKPEFTLHVAANYPSKDRIQQNARVELDEKPWLEDLTTLSETNSTCKSLGGHILGIDVTADGKTAAVVTKDDDYNLCLHLINIATAEKKSEPIDIKNLKDRVGLCARFMPDSSSVFVGSLSTLITSAGKPVSTGIDLSSVQLKEKYSIECCDISSKYIACGLTTFPWGGRSLHLSLFDHKAKKCLKTLEVLKFRFGGSAQFGVKCCAVSGNESMVCACVKQTNKAEVRAMVWSTTTWSTLYSTNVEDDCIRRCLFVDEHTILLASSLAQQSKEDTLPKESKSLVWNVKNNNGIQYWDESELRSVLCKYKGGILAIRWYLPIGNATVQVWSKGASVEGSENHRYDVRGLQDVTDIVASGESLICSSHDELKLFAINDLDVVDPGPRSREGHSAFDVNVENVTFLPRSDELLVVHRNVHNKPDVTLSVSTLAPKPEDLALTPTLFKQEHLAAGKIHPKHKCFRGAGCTLDVASSTGDGNFFVLKSGNSVRVLSRVSGATYSLPASEASSGNQGEDVSFSCAVSQKDNMAGVVLTTAPHRILLFDLKSKQNIRKFELGAGATDEVSDFIFMPSNGYLISYHRDASHTLLVWNQKTGKEVNRVSDVHVAYGRTSPASDRLALSTRKNKNDGVLLLRNCENKFSAILDCGAPWLCSNDSSDAEFSVDGTVLIGVSMATGVCRAWNAGNGDVLKDINVSFTSAAEVVGMPTNTHIVFHDDRLTVADMGTGELVAVLPLEHAMSRKTTHRGLSVSPKGTFIAGADEIGQLKIFRCINFAAIKRKTTLQRMKSYTK